MTVDRDFVYTLQKSRRIIGEVNPIVIDYDNEVLSGQHRKEAGWLTTHKIDTRKLAEKWGVSPLMAKDMMRLHMNVQRKVSREETKTILLRMATTFEKQGVPQEKIAAKVAEKVPYTHQYVLQLLPDKYKQVKFAPKSEVKLVSPLRPKVEVKEYKPKETWEHRKAVMSPPVSKMDEAVYLALQQKGVPVEFQKQFCIQSTTPDLYFPRHNLAVYIDLIKLHQKREIKDEALREFLSKRHKIHVLAIPYEGYSDSEVKKILGSILEALKTQ